MARRTHSDAEWMEQAIALAREGVGRTRPNPPVGAVVCAGARVVGSGFHRVAGGPHAEVEALQEAGRKARGATLYVTLEPCSTAGQTPPCTDAITAAGIRRVVAAVRDPNPRHSGRGFRRLRADGIDVAVGAGASSARVLIEPFSKWIRHGRPFVTLKLATTLDGKIADSARRSKWITSAESRRWVQDLRRQADALMVGVGTVLADDPSLTPRPCKGRSPYRVILDSRGRTPLSARVLTDNRATKTIIATTRQCPAARRKRIERTGASVLVCRESRGRVSVASVLSELGKMGVLHVLCEGGGAVAGCLQRDGLVDSLALFIGASLIGVDGVSSVEGVSWPLCDAPRFDIRDCRLCGGDVVIEARPRRK